MIYASLFPNALSKGARMPAGWMGAISTPAELPAMALRHGVVERLCLITSELPVQKLLSEEHGVERSIRELQEEFGRNQVQVRSLVDLPSILADSRHLFVERADLCPSFLQTRNAAQAPVATCGLVNSVFAADMLQTWISLHFLPQPQDVFVVPCDSTRRAVDELIRQTGELISGNRTDSLPSSIRMETIPYALDPSAFVCLPKEAARQLLGLHQDQTVLLWLGRLNEDHQTDLLTLLNAVALARPESLNLHLVLAGDCSDPKFPARLLQTAASLGINHRLSLYADVSHAGKQALFSAADIFLSLDDTIQESHSIPLLEAMASGLPVIASAWGGYRDVVQNGATGILVPTIWNPVATRLTTLLALLINPPGTKVPVAQMSAVDVAALSQAIQKLAENKDLRMRMGIAGQERVTAHFSWKAVMPRFSDLWKEQQDLARARHSGSTGHHFLDLDRIFSSYVTAKLEPEMQAQSILSGEAPLTLAKARQDPHCSIAAHQKALQLSAEPITLAELPQRLVMGPVPPGICPYPFSRLETGWSLFIPCCNNWLTQEYKALQPGSDLWNGPQAQELRRRILRGDYSLCQLENCGAPRRTLDEWEESPRSHGETPLTPEILAQMRKGETHLNSGPVSVAFSTDNRCNLKCHTCRSDYIVRLDPFREKWIEAIDAYLADHRDSIEVLKLSGNGEVFFSPWLRRLLKDFHRGLYPKARCINLLSNGTLMDAATIEALRPGSDLIRLVSISVDAGDCGTYKRVRGGDWNRLVKNLQWISEQRQAHRFDFYRISFVVRKSNYRSIPDFIELGKSLQVDNIFLSSLYDWGMRDFHEEAVHLPSHPEYQECRRVLERFQAEPMITITGWPIMT